MADTATLLAYTIPNALQQTISIISTNLLYPVMIVLIILIAGSLTELGGFFFEWRNRNRDLGRMEEGAVRARVMLEDSDFVGAFGTLGKSCSNSFVHAFLYRLSALYRGSHDKTLLEAKVEKSLQDTNFEMTKKLERSRFVARVGPMFGLMGTLIPMGPALLGLSSGDIDTLANNLIIAFGTTVVGLMAGAIGFMVATVRTRWYRQDMSDIEYISEILFGEPGSDLCPADHNRVYHVANMANVANVDHTDRTDRTDPATTVTRPRPTEDDLLGVIGTIASKSWESVHYALIFTRSGLISAKTAGSILANPAVWMGLILSVNAAMIAAGIAGITTPFSYMVIINLFICATFVILIYLMKERARSESKRLESMPVNGVLANDKSNFELPYSDIKRIEIDKSRNIKILTGSGWIEMGRVEKSSIGTLGVLHAALPDRIVEV
ncbi:MAG: MotA/TolQ/ExbB proton channel family protein [Euryarchaeota archaeon]|nr:MotA/TolQ/ExbB proton channel family protein [Euryarchaeota archaeon]